MNRSLPVVLVLLVALGARGLAQEPSPRPDDVARAAEEIEEGDRLLEQGKTAEALERFTRARELDPYSSRAPYMMAECEFALARRSKDPEGFERARQMLRVAERLDPSSGRTFFLWGMIGAETKRHRDAVVGFQESLRRGWRIPDSRVNLAQSLYFWGEEQAKQDVNATEVIRTLQGAVDLLETIKDNLEFDPEVRKRYRKLWIEALTLLAAMRQKANDLPEAEAILLRLAKIEPTNYLHFYNLAVICAAGKRNQEALKYHQKALDLNPDESWDEPLKYMGYILSQEGESEKAERLLVRYAAHHPDAWGSHFYLGDHYFRVGRLEEAVAEFTRCVELDSRVYSAVYKLAQVLLRLNRNREADKWLAVYHLLEAAK